MAQQLTKGVARIGHQRTRVRRTAALAVAAAGVSALALATPTVSHAAPASATCTLSSAVMGGVPVIVVEASGVRHNATYVLNWVEPQITQTQYVSSDSRGALGQTVLNDQGSGTYSVSVSWAGNSGTVPATSCSVHV